jgi:sn1-specific diacylglycerol lipase
VASDGLVDVRSLQNAAHFMKFAFASYGWMLYVWAHPGKGMAKLCCGRGCGFWEHVFKGKDGIPLDVRRAPYLNREAILQASGLREKDLLFVRYENQIPHVLPYYIAIDHEKKCLVIAIRGSMSFDDVVRDLKFDPVNIDDWLTVGVPWNAPRPQTMGKSGKSKFAAHNGIFEASVAIVDDLKAQKIVESQLLGSSAPLKNYDLVLCGHSLGAGCAFLVAIHLRCYFPTLKCYSFSPPGALVSSEIAEQSRDWCISTVCGKEMIPRITLNTIENLRDDMVHLGTFCRKSKFQLMLSWITGRVWSDPDLYYSAENLPDEAHKWMQIYERNIARKSHLSQVIELANKFGPPGRVMYLKPTGKFKSKQKSFWGSKHSREYVCEWTTGTSIVEEGILLTGRMMKDHMPDYSYALLRVLAEHRGLEPVFVDDTEGETLREEMEKISAVNMDEEVNKV